MVQIVKIVCHRVGASSRRSHHGSWQAGENIFDAALRLLTEGAPPSLQLV